MSTKKYRNRYAADFGALLDALVFVERVAFVRGLAAGEGYAVARFEQGREALAKPQRECVDMFLRRGMTFEDIADRTGYLLDNIPAHIVLAVDVLVPAGTECADADADAEEAVQEVAVARRRSRWFWWVVLGVSTVVLVFVAGRFFEVDEVPEVAAVPVEEAVDSVVVAAPVAGRAALVSISQDEDGGPASMPQIGRARYDEYLSQAVMPMAGESRGDVTMTFTVNRYGRPSHIRVTSVLTREAHHEAIRLLANGPEWSPSEIPVTITMRFE